MKTLMPVLFLGHGSPMNAIAHNSFTQTLESLGRELAPPKSILVVSAHWMTQSSTWVTGMQGPRTIHDFFGFPQALFDVQYPAPGSHELAQAVSDNIQEPAIGIDMNSWGLDHGTWSVLRHVYPHANVPVVQLSLDMTRPPEFHFALGAKLKFLREQGVLIVGSGNMVHNLRQVRWEPDAQPFDWALEHDAWLKTQIEKGDYRALVDSALATKAAQLSVPTMDHYLPLLYVLGAAQPGEALTFDVEGIQNGSISMRSVRLG